MQSEILAHSLLVHIQILVCSGHGQPKLPCKYVHLVGYIRLYVLAETQTLHLCLARALIVSWLCRHFWGKWAACIFLGERASDIACGKHQLDSYCVKRQILTPNHGSLPLHHIFYSSVISYRDKSGYEPPPDQQLPPCRIPTYCKGKVLQRRTAPCHDVLFCFFGCTGWANA